jgi:hypothetical protein
VLFFCVFVAGEPTGRFAGLTHLQSVAIVRAVKTI